MSRQGFKRLPIEVRRAAMEGKCGNRHSGYAFVRGFVYCPWCGVELRFELRCETCGKSFNSQASFTAHLDREFVELHIHCPVGAGHVVHLRKNRGKIFCDYCQKEYPLPPRKLKGNGPQARKSYPIKSGDGGVLGLDDASAVVVEKSGSSTSERENK